MLEQLVSNQFEYKKLTEAEQKARGILGRLVGVIADTKEPTRNGRKYSDKLWENVFKNPIMQEKIANRCCFGELNHPADRTDTDMEKVAICLAEQPKKGKDGKLYGVFDILSTPNGRILKALCDYGCNIGISSRGQGDLITDMNGDEAVDPDTYDCECFDAVLVPGVESARLKYVTEDFHRGKTLKAVLAESLQKATDSEREIMEETLKNLDINLNEEVEEEATEEGTEVEEKKVTEAEKVEDNEETGFDFEETEGADENAEEVEVEPSDDEVEENNEEESGEENSEEVVDERTDEEIFLDFLANNFDEDKIKEVCNILDIEVEKDNADEAEDEETSDESEDESEASDDESDEAIDGSDEEESENTEESKKEATDSRSEVLVDSLKEALKGKSDLENMVKALQEKLAVSDAKVNELDGECSRYKSAIARLSVLAKSNKDLKESVSKLEESLDEKNAVIETQKTRISRLVKSRKENLNNSTTLTESVNAKDNEINKLNENLTSVKAEYEDKIKALNEEFEIKTKESAQKIDELNLNIEKTTSIKESYRKLANKAVNKYIEVKAEILGLTPVDIKRKLGESYTMEDVDQVCEDLKSYQLNVSKLPFSIDKQVSVKVNSAANRSASAKKAYEDDAVDDDLIRLANFNY